MDVSEKNTHTYTYFSKWNFLNFMHEKQKCRKMKIYIYVK